MPAGVSNNNVVAFDAAGNQWVAKNIAIANQGSSNPVSIMQPSLALNYIIALQGIFPARNGVEPYIAEIVLFGGNFAPRGWAFCDGSLLSIAQNTALFSLLGTTYGGNGQTTFALPDLRGRVAIHAGQGPGLTPRDLGESFGTEQVTLTVAQLPAHSHSVLFVNP